MLLSVGIDWAEYKHDVAILSGPGQLIDAFEIENTIEGFLELLDAVRALQLRVNADQVAFAIEAKNHRLVEFLLAQGFTGYWLDPNKTPGYRLRYKSSGSKNDPDDAFMFADVLLRDRDQLPVITPASSLVEKLRLHLVDRDKFVQEQTRLSNRLTDCLREYYPEALKLFSDVAGTTALAFIAAYPMLAQAQQVTETEVRQFLKQHHSYREARVKHIMKVLGQKSIPVPEAVVDAKALLAVRTIRMLQEARAAVTEYDTKIRTLSENNADIEIFRSLPGAGVILGAGLLALFGEDRARYRSAQEVQSYIGTSPRTIMSGQFRAVQFRFGCNRFYRKLLDNLAWCSTLDSEWAKNYYQRKKREGKRHHYALRVLGNSLVSLAFTMWQKRTKYDESFHLASMQKHRMRNEAKTT
jgi:transposase